MSMFAWCRSTSRSGPCTWRCRLRRCSLSRTPCATSCRSCARATSRSRRRSCDCDDDDDPLRLGGVPVPGTADLAHDGARGHGVRLSAAHRSDHHRAAGGVGGQFLHLRRRAAVHPDGARDEQRRRHPAHLRLRHDDRRLAAGLTAAAATIGPIIPPSLPMVVYGAAAEVSVGKLFIAGVIPGVLMGLALMVLCSVMARRLDLSKGDFPTPAELWRKFREAFWALMTPVVLLGGMLSGVFTPTEAAAVATFYALILGLFVYRSFSVKARSEEHTSELQSRRDLVCRLL